MIPIILIITVLASAGVQDYVGEVTMSVTYYEMDTIDKSLSFDDSEYYNDKYYNDMYAKDGDDWKHKMVIPDKSEYERKSTSIIDYIIDWIIPKVVLVYADHEEKYKFVLVYADHEEKYKFDMKEKYSVEFNNDGSKMYLIDPDGSINEYDLTIHYDIYSIPDDYSISMWVNNYEFQDGIIDDYKIYNNEVDPTYTWSTNTGKSYNYTITTTTDNGLWETTDSITMDCNNNGCKEVEPKPTESEDFDIFDGLFDWTNDIDINFVW